VVLELEKAEEEFDNPDDEDAFELEQNEKLGSRDVRTDTRELDEDEPELMPRFARGVSKNASSDVMEEDGAEENPKLLAVCLSCCS
jgi:hypothetical protein